MELGRLVTGLDGTICTAEDEGCGGGACICDAFTLPTLDGSFSSAGPDPRLRAMEPTTLSDGIMSATTDALGSQ
jgi:hypothetical protein